MYVLGRHEALGEEKDFSPVLFVFCHIHDDDGMAGESSLYKYITYHHLVAIVSHFQFFAQGIGPCIDINRSEIASEIIIGRVFACFLDQMGRRVSSSSE